MIIRRCGAGDPLVIIYGGAWGPGAAPARLRSRPNGETADHTDAVEFNAVLVPSWNEFFPIREIREIRGFLPSAMGSNLARSS
jgi:hypothetical protein